LQYFKLLATDEPTTDKYIGNQLDL